MKKVRLVFIFMHFLCCLGILFTDAKDASNFGKTHFIVGYTQNQGSEKQEERIVKPSSIPYNLLCDNCVKNVYFAPDDDICAVLFYLIAQETKYIKIAMFTFTEKNLAKALVAAQSRGVQVEVVIDPSNLYGKYNKLSLLDQGSVKLFVYDAGRIQKSMPGLMHNKFILFGNNILKKSLICTGSFNFTRAAHRNNQENILVLDDQQLVLRYEKQFEQLKKYSDYYQKKSAVKT